MNLSVIYITFALIFLQKYDQVNSQPWIPQPGTAPNWMLIHEYFVEYAQNYTDLINVAFWGDSLTANWDQEIFSREFLQYGPANFGIGGDKCENNLYRMINGNLEPLNSKMIVLMIGGNNIGFGHIHDEVLYGIFTILQTILDYIPQTKILLLGIIPNNLGPPWWDKCKAMNADLAPLANNQTVYFLEIWDEFLVNSPGYGYVDPEIFPDGVHLSKKGYEIYANALRPTFEYVWKEASNPKSNINKN